MCSEVQGHPRPENSALVHQIPHQTGSFDRQNQVQDREGVPKEAGRTGLPEEDGGVGRKEVSGYQGRIRPDLCPVGAVVLGAAGSAAEQNDTFNTNIRKVGVPQSVIMKLTGHKTSSMFQRYNTVDLADAKEAYQKLEGLSLGGQEESKGHRATKVLP